MSRRIIDRATIVRSMTHPYPLHASAFTLTSIPTIDVPLQMSPRDPRHWPFIGSVVDYLADQRGEPAPPIARNIGLALAAQLAPAVCRRRQRRARTAPGSAARTIRCGPISKARARATSTYTFGNKTIHCQDPYGPLAPGCRFGLAADARLPDGMTLDRLNRRRSLLAQFDDARRIARRPAPRRARSTISASRPSPI